MNLAELLETLHSYIVSWSPSSKASVPDPDPDRNPPASHWLRPEECTGVQNADTRDNDHSDQHGNGERNGHFVTGNDPQGSFDGQSGNGNYGGDGDGGRQDGNDESGCGPPPPNNPPARNQAASSRVAGYICVKHRHKPLIYGTAARSSKWHKCQTREWQPFSELL